MFDQIEIFVLSYFDLIGWRSFSSYIFLNMWQIFQKHVCCVTNAVLIKIALQSVPERTYKFHRAIILERNLKKKRQKNHVSGMFSF